MRIVPRGNTNKIKGVVIMENNKTILQAVHDTAKSFYNKAHYTKEETSTHIIYRLYSYRTLVAILEVSKTGNRYYNYNKMITLYLDHDRQTQKDFYSQTTLRHIKELIKQATDTIRHDTEYAIAYYDKKSILHLYSIEILRDATKKDLFQYSLQYDM